MRKNQKYNYVANVRGMAKLTYEDQMPHTLVAFNEYPGRWIEVKGPDPKKRYVRWSKI